MQTIIELQKMLEETKAHKLVLLGKQKHYVLLASPAKVREINSLIDEADKRIIKLSNSIDLLNGKNKF